jgi:hypothetical protein
VAESPASPPRMSTSAAKPFDRLDPDMRAVIVGLLATFFLHLFLLLVAPHLLEFGMVRVSPSDVGEERPPPVFTVELPPEEPADQKPATPFKFVEVNPDAPENTPDKTANFGAQNQQVAQEKPTPDGVSESPAMEGQEKIKSTQIVDGTRAQSQQAAPQLPTPDVVQEIQQAAALARAAATPLSGFEKFEGKEADSIGSNIAKFDPNAIAVPEKIDGVADGVEDATSLAVRIDRSRPMPRQVVEKGNRPAIFEKNASGTKNVGVVAHNALKNEFGVYLQKLIDAVDARWQDQIRASKHYPAPGSEVMVTFELNAAGEVSQIKKTEGTAGEQATNWSVSAISPGAGFSYGEWTPQMIAILGEKQELTFYFLYR